MKTLYSKKEYNTSVLKWPYIPIAEAKGFTACSGKQNRQISKVALRKMMSVYQRKYNAPLAAVEFDSDGTVYLRLQTTSYPGLTRNQARDIIQFLLADKIGGKGYTQKDGVAMSVNAKEAIEHGLERASQITQEDLNKAGFHYPPEFFRWLVNLYNIEPDERHHVTKEIKYVGFYSEEQIRHMAESFDLALLYNIYSGRTSRTKELKRLNIKYARVRLPLSMIGGTTDRTTEAIFLYCRGVLFYATWLGIPDTANGVEILKVYDERPQNLTKNRRDELIKVEDGLLKTKHKFYKTLDGKYISLPPKKNVKTNRTTPKLKSISKGAPTGTTQQKNRKISAMEFLQELFSGEQNIPQAKAKTAHSANASVNAQKGFCRLLGAKDEQCTVQVENREKKQIIESQNNNYQNNLPRNTNQIGDAAKLRAAATAERRQQIGKKTRRVIKNPWKY